MFSETDIHKALEQWFEYDGFREGQYAPVEAVVNGRDAVVVMPTGSGKSLCYQLAALILPGTTLVISPLIALMKDQVDALARRKIPATFLNSSVPFDEMSARLDHMAAGDYKLVYIAPERFRNELFMRTLAHTLVSMVAVDEAHCISQWGHDFRPDYLTIRDALASFPDVRIMAVTATATPDVRADIARQLRLGVVPRAEPYIQVQGFSRPNLNLAVCTCRTHDAKLAHVARLVAQQHTGIVYVATRKHAQTVYEKLLAEKSRLGESTILLYHGALSDAARAKVQNEFMSAKYPVVVATNAFGMGVDRADIRFVVHWDIPGSIESYYQEVGRAGRDGLTAWCELLFNYADVKTQEFFIDGANPGIGAARTLLSELKKGFAKKARTFDEDEWAGRLGVNGIAVSTLIGFFERIGAVTRERVKGNYRAPAFVQYNTDVPPEKIEAAFAGFEEKARRDNDRLRQMIRYCDTPGCRHAFILNYFGEKTAGADVCGGCDHCGPRKALDPLSEAQWIIVQKILSCVYRMHGVGDADNLCEVLLGEKTTFVTKNGFEKLSTFDILHGFEREILRRLVEALVRAGCAIVRIEEDGQILLSQKGLRVAKREEKEFTIRWPLKEPPPPAMPAPRERRVAVVAAVAPMKPGDYRLASELRTWRKDTAAGLGLPAFRIMTNKTLDAIATEHPASLSALSNIYGIYQRTLDEYGEEILEIVADCASSSAHP